MTDTRYRVTAYGQTWHHSADGTAGWLTVRTHDSTVTGQGALRDELDYHGVPGHMQRQERGSFSFGGSVTRWEPLADTTDVHDLADRVEQLALEVDTFLDATTVEQREAILPAWTAVNESLTALRDGLLALSDDDATEVEA